MTVAEIAAGVSALSAVAMAGAVIAIVLRYRADVRRYADAVVDSLAREAAAAHRADAIETTNRNLQSALERSTAAYRDLLGQIAELQDTIDACHDPIAVRERLRSMLQDPTDASLTGPGNRDQ